MYLKNIFLPALMLMLSACHQESEPVAASAVTASQTAVAASAAETAVSAASDIAASGIAASDAAASATNDDALGGKLSTMNQAKWQTYRCDENQKIDVRYYQSDAGPSAQIKFKGQTFTAPFSAENSNEDLTAFANGSFTWTIGNQFQTDFYREANGFLVQLENSEDAEIPIENTLVMNCAPAK